MTPEQVASALRQIADAVDTETYPSKQAVAASLKVVVASMHRESGQLTRFLADKEKAALAGVDHLLNELRDVVNTMNPQDHGREKVERAVDTVAYARNAIQNAVQTLSRVEI